MFLRHPGIPASEILEPLIVVALTSILYLSFRTATYTYNLAMYNTII